MAKGECEAMTQAVRTISVDEDASILVDSTSVLHGCRNMHKQVITGKVISYHDHLSQKQHPAKARFRMLMLRHPQTQGKIPRS